MNTLLTGMPFLRVRNKFESSIKADSELTHDEFVSATKRGGLPFWVWIFAGTGVVFIVSVGIVVRRRLAQGQA
jgi:hypothetical protein